MRKFEEVYAINVNDKAEKWYERQLRPYLSRLGRRGVRGSTQRFRGAVKKTKEKLGEKKQRMRNPLFSFIIVLPKDLSIFDKKQIVFGCFSLFHGKDILLVSGRNFLGKQSGFLPLKSP